MIFKRLEEIIQLLTANNILGKEILSFNESCQYMSISSSFLYKLTADRKIPYYIPNGKKIYFKRTELDTWLSRNRLGTKSEIADDTLNTLLRKS